MEQEKYLAQDLTFIIPLRIESLERLENTIASIHAILADFSTHITVIEAARTPSYLLKELLPQQVKHIFIEDNDDIFYRTKYLNHVTRQTPTAYLAIWDSDVIVHSRQIFAALEWLRNGLCDFAFPYDGVFIDTGVEPRSNYLCNQGIDMLMGTISQMHPPYGMSATGGGFLVNADTYRDCGMENERFYGWGPEDGERVKRWQILGRKIGRTPGPMFHLSHPRGINSGHRSEVDQLASTKEYLRICKMSTAQLAEEVKNW
jgi:hypothetical protein